MKDEDIELKSIASDISQGEPSRDSDVKRKIKKSDKFIGRLKKASSDSREYYDALSSDSREYYDILHSPENRAKVKSFVAKLKAGGKKGYKNLKTAKKDLSNIQKNLGMGEGSGETVWFEKPSKKTNPDDFWFEKKGKGKETKWF